MESLLEKLPADVRSTWARHAFRLKPHHATIIDLYDWLVEFTAAEEGIQPSCSSSSQQRPPQSPNGSRTGAARTPTSGESKTKGQSPMRQRVVTFATQETNNGCEVCKTRPGYGLTRCKEFLGMTQTERAEQVNTLRNCFRCLGRGHYSSNCLKENDCNVEGCRKKHHYLLHGATRIHPKSSEESSSRLSVCVTARTIPQRTVLCTLSLYGCMERRDGWSRSPC